ncbi:227 kDa spindle- and centromere-associated protein-like [Melitaea cinxia]|uniref:227 kDa spindle- and centromere-associated protein-like n=1 Tax=Melitaea cinxia TaxID=113334 RepID=UPI001E273FD1|nr:227 kDa spindle- and centromere-associated protein-like [Melitaea cinxia]
MKSKSFELPKNTPEKALQNKTYDFIKFYSPESETNAKLAEKHKSEDGVSNENSPKTKLHFSKRERSPNKKKKFKNASMNISSLNVDGNQPQASGSENNFKATSTPNSKGKKDINENVKSIMKNSSVADSSLDISTVTVTKNKSKKRNKSVSFMLDDTEVVANKRSKSDLSIMVSKLLQSSKTKFNSNKQKKNKRKSQDEKENKADVTNFKVETITSDTVQKDSLKNKTKSDNEQSDNAMDVPDTKQENQKKIEKKKNKRQKKPKKVENASSTTDGSKETESEKETVEDKDKKIKKKKRHVKQVKESTDPEGQPASKASKKEIKPDVVAQDLENLSIGDNAHTLTNLLDEMSVVDKKKKKHKPKKNKQKATRDASPDASDNNATQEKEKVKWMKRKWNKDRKGAMNDDKLATSVVVENLPLKIMCNYRKLLTDHFAQFGVVKQIGIAEVYSIEQPEVFTTTISFDSEDSVNKALDEDNSQFEGNRIRIKRPLPPTQTTLVVRSYADLSEPAISSVFTSAGKIRNVRRLVKGKKSMGTAFIEFDGPEAVERAIKIAEDVKIGGKKIFVAKYEIRNKNKKLKTDKKHENDAGSDNDSSD